MLQFNGKTGGMVRTRTNHPSHTIFEPSRNYKIYRCALHLQTREHLTTRVSRQYLPYVSLFHRKNEQAGISHTDGGITYDKHTKYYTRGAKTT